jgi:flagellar basal body P-ring formation protein FlgA
MKRMIAALGLSLMFTSPVGAADFAAPAQLRSTAMIDGDAIRLGDLWENIGPKAATAIAAAPQPGKRITLEARWLQAVAAANGIEWHAASNFDRTVVERAGQRVDPSAIEAEIREALDMEGLPKNSGFEIPNRASLAVMIPVGVDPTVAVRDLSLDPRTQRFVATIEVPAGSPSATRMRISGRTFITTRVPVLTHPMARGETIADRDIEWQDMREEGVRQDTVIQPMQLVGMEPRYQIRPGQPIRLNDLQKPIAVTRNSNVTLVLRTPFMTLTALGRAIDEGGRGDLVKVTNLQTKQVVEGRIEGPGTVVVGGNGRSMTN